MFGARRTMGGSGSMENINSNNKSLDESIRALNSATLKYSDHMVLKGVGVLRDAFKLYNKGEKASHNDFSPLFEIIETLKSDRSLNVALLNHLEVVGALIPIFGINLLPSDVKVQEHVNGCIESAEFYLNRIQKCAKEEEKQGTAEVTLNWLNCARNLINELKMLGGAGAQEGAQPNKQTSDQNDNNMAALNISKPVEPRKCEEEKAVESVTLEGTRWYVRNVQSSPQPILITPEGINQAVAIEDCRKTALKVDGKINAVLMDKCTQVQLELGDVVSSVELVSCNRIKLFLNGSTRLVVLDGCEGVEVYLGGEGSKNVKIVTAKCMEINVLIQASLIDSRLMGSEEGEDYVEMAIPVQFSSQLNEQGKLVTQPHDHVGV